MPSKNTKQQSQEIENIERSKMVGMNRKITQFLGCF
jgi:hypothetical protein